MKKISDEMLNDYIDNQLDSSSLNELKQNLSGDEESLNKLKALKIVDSTLREIEVFETPLNFTDKMMGIISKHAKSVRPKINYFFTGIVSLFGIIISAVLVSLIIVVIKQNPSLGNFQTAENVKKIVDENLSSFNAIFANNQILFAGGILTGLLILGFIIILDSHKNFKNKLKSISH
jgi:hypothetical protein